MESRRSFNLYTVDVAAGTLECKRCTGRGTPSHPGRRWGISYFDEEPHAARWTAISKRARLK
jgi:hypothetical protein